MRTTAAGLEEQFGKRAAARVIIEAGTHSSWVSRQLESYGHEVVVANARKVRLIYEGDCKNDRLDARMLARLGRVDVQLLAPIRHRRAETQADLAVVRSRESLVAARVKLLHRGSGQEDRALLRVGMHRIGKRVQPRGRSYQNRPEQ